MTDEQRGIASKPDRPLLVLTHLFFIRLFLSFLFPNAAASIYEMASSFTQYNQPPNGLLQYFRGRAGSRVDFDTATFVRRFRFPRPAPQE